MKIQLSEEARALRNASMKEWKRNNPDKIREYNRRYWEKKAKQQDPEQVEAMIIRLHRGGMSLREIAAVVKTNHMHVSRVINRVTALQQ